MFTGVCLSTGGGTYSRGVPGPRVWGAWSGGCLVLGVALSQGVWSLGGSGPGGCLVPGSTWWRPPGRLLLWAVCILLECILDFKLKLQNIFVKFPKLRILVWVRGYYTVLIL